MWSKACQDTSEGSLLLCDMGVSLCIHPLVVFYKPMSEKEVIFDCIFDSNESIIPVLQTDVILFFNIH